MNNSEIERNDWIEKELASIPDLEIKKLAAEFDYRYVDPKAEKHQDEWIIYEYNKRTNQEIKAFGDFENILNGELKCWSVPRTVRRSVSISATSTIKDDFEWHVCSPTERISDLVDRAQHLAMKYSLHLEPNERQLTLGLLYDYDCIKPVDIENLAKIVLASPYYERGDAAAHSLYTKFKEASYVELLATVESLRR